MTENAQAVCITGGAGFIGSHFCRHLGQADRLHSTLDIRPAREPRSGVREVVGDVRDAEAVRAALKGADAVLHLAAAHHDFGIERDTFFSVNEGAARTLCAEMDAAGIKQICFFSTVAVYGSDPASTAEESDCSPDTPYGESKLGGERVFRAWVDEDPSRSVLVIRPTVTFGPGHFANMYTLVRQISSGAFVSVGAGTNRKSLVFVDNLVEATLALWDQLAPGRFDVFNMVDKPDLTSREIETAVYKGLGKGPPRFGIPMWAALLAALPFDIVIKLTGMNLPISSARVRKFADANTVFSADKLQAAGIQRSVPLPVGIEQMVRWYTTEGHDLPLDRSIPPARVLPMETSGEA